jgi:ADP-ribose pyrophosphatase
MTPHGPWTILKSNAIYQDPWVAVRVDDVLRPDGKPGIHSVIRIKSGVNVVALDDERHVYLAAEFHYGVGRVTIEAVSGGIEDGETPAATARRELREELGIDAEMIHDLGMVDPFTANVISPTRLFLATSLRHVESRPEGTELIRRVRLPLAEAVAMVLDGRITHAPTCVNLLKTWLRTGAETPPRVHPLTAAPLSRPAQSP